MTTPEVKGEPSHLLVQESNPTFEAGHHDLHDGTNPSGVVKADFVLREETSPTDIASPESHVQDSRNLLEEVRRHSFGSEMVSSTATFAGPKLGKRLDLIANILEQELEELRDGQSAEISSSLNRQIELIRKLANESRQGDIQEPHHTEEDEKERSSAKEEKANGPAVPAAIQTPPMPKCEVQRLSMDEWKRVWSRSSVISAYYRNPTIFKGGDYNREQHDRPQRVLINSEFLFYEIENVADITPPHVPVVVAPPYKVLVKYHPKIGEKASELQGELKRMEEKSTPKTEQAPASPGGQLGVTASDDSSAASKAAKTSTEGVAEGVPSQAPTTADKTANNLPKNMEERQRKRMELTTRIEHLQLLDNFIKTELVSYLDLQNSVKAGTLEKIPFEDLWYLFQPGEVLFYKDRGHDQLCVSYATTGGQQRKRPPTNDGTGSRTMNSSGHGTWSPFTVDFYTMESDGYSIGPLDGCKRIKHYVGERKITDLEIYPIIFHPHRDDVIKRLVARGKKYLSSYGHKIYNGATCPPDGQVSPEEIRGDIYVDLKEYYTAIPMKPDLGSLSRTSPDVSEVEEVMAGGVWTLCDHEVDQKLAEQFMLSHQAELEPLELELFPRSEANLPLFPCRVPAYCFRTRRYVVVDVNIVAEIDKSDEVRNGSFKDLVIPDSHRKLLISLIKNQVVEAKAGPGPDTVDDASTQIDIVRGKGRGLIFLLHGPPGSGKTSTAETLAAYTRRPLYPITCGDLGTVPGDVELSLTAHTDRAQRWGCILLLDEADVFLARRDWRDTNHNALVSVFLRQLEYYSGILFLTTNRVGVLDEAFKSRIHVSLAYPSIKLQATVELWEGILNRLERDNKTAAVKIKFDRNALISFAKNHYKKHEKSGTAWNARQIRNAFQLAIALGHHDRDKKLEAAGLTADEASELGDKKWMRVRLTKDNFQNIAKTARDFEDYLHAVRGHDSDIAKHMSLRYDEHDDNEQGPQSTWVRKDYGRTRQPISPQVVKAEKSSPYLSPSPRDRQGSRMRREQRSPSDSYTRRARLGEEQDCGEDDEESEKEDDDIFEESSSDDD